MDEAWKYRWELSDAAGVVRREERAARVVAGVEEEEEERFAELDMHVLIALTLPLGLASQPLAEVEAHVRADESILES